MKNKIIGTLIMLIVVLISSCIIAYGEGNSYYSIATKELSGNRIQADININNAEGLYGAQLYLNFNNSSLKGIEILKGNLIVDGEPSVRLIQQKIDNTNGIVTYTITYVGHVDRTSASGTLFSVIFEKTGSGTYDLVVSDKSIFSDANGNRILGFEDGRDYDTSIKDIRIGNKTIEGFSMGKSSFNIERAGGLTIQPKVTVIPNNSDAKVVIASDDKTPNVTKINVTSKNGKASKEYTINFVTLVTVNNTTAANSIKAGQDASITVKVTNNRSSKIEATLIVALYDSNDRFVTYTALKQVIEAGKSADLTGMLGGSLIKQGYKIRCYTIDSFEGMYPYSRATEFIIQ